MKVWGINHQPSGRATKLRGRMIAVKDKRLGWRIQSWPRKRGQYQSERQRQWGEWFAAVNGYLRQPDAWTYKWAKDLTDGTIFMPRDLLLKLSAGRFWTIELESGGAIYSEQLMADQVQALLDAITTTPGAMLYRGPDGWRGLAPGAQGNVLTISPDEGRPVWAAAAAGGGYSFAKYPISTNSTSAHQFKGHLSQPMQPIAYKGAWVNVAAMGGYKIRAVVGTAVAGVVTSVTRSAWHQLPSPTGDGNYWLPIDAPVIAQYPTQLFIGAEHDQSPTTPMRLWGSTTGATTPWPDALGFTFCSFDGQPQVGDTLATGVGEVMAGYEWAGL